LATLAEQINHHHAECESAMQAGLEHALEAGRLLVEAKGQCPHGAWGKWLADSFEASERTAQRYMMIATRWPEIEAKATRVSDLPYRDAVNLLAEPQPETPTKPKSEFEPASQAPVLWSRKEAHKRACKRLDIECAIGAVFNWAAKNRVKDSHKFSWLCPAEGWMNRERGLSLILTLLDESREDLLTEVVCHHVGILPLEEGDFPIVCMCDLAIGIHKFAGDLSPDEAPHRIAPCDQYGDGCVFSYCHSEADRQRIADTVEEWLRDGPPSDVFEAIFGTEAAI